METLRRCHDDPISVSTAYLSERIATARTLCLLARRRMVFHKVLSLRQMKIPLRCCGAAGDSIAYSLVFYII